MGKGSSEGAQNPEIVQWMPEPQGTHVVSAHA